MIKTLDDLLKHNLTGQTALLRVDYNVAHANNHIMDSTRIDKSFSTLKLLLNHKAQVILISHLGRPQKTGKEKLSLEFILPYLQSSFPNERCIFCPSIDALQENLGQGNTILLLENIRFDAREEENTLSLAKELAACGTYYVNDAFSVSHRAHASVYHLPQLLPSYMGKDFESEIQALQYLVTSPKKPMHAILGGAKISTKLPVIKNLLPQMDTFIFMGGIGNTFLKALGYEIGESLYEEDLLEECRHIIEYTSKQEKNIVLPKDVIVIDSQNQVKCKDIQNIFPQEKIVDAGPLTLEAMHKTLKTAHTILWNGALGIFEQPYAAQGTMETAKLLAQLTKQYGLVTIAGGGETLQAINQAGFFQDFSHVSSAGGAFLEYLSGKKLPGISVLECT